MTAREGMPAELELKSCPFCNGPAEHRCGGPGNWYVRCSICGAATDDGMRDTAVTRWNTRAASQPAPAPVVGREAEVFKELMTGPSKDAQIKIWRDRAMLYAQKLDELGVFVDVDALLNDALLAPPSQTSPNKVIGRVSGKERDGNQAHGMPHAICHACGLGYKCRDVDCPNDRPDPTYSIPSEDRQTAQNVGGES